MEAPVGARHTGPTLLVRSHFVYLGIPAAIIASISFRRDFTINAFVNGLIINFAVLLSVWLVTELVNAILVKRFFPTALPPFIVTLYGAGMGVLALLVAEALETVLGRPLTTLDGITLALFAVLGAVVFVLSSLLEISRRDYRNRHRIALESAESGTSGEELRGELAEIFDALSAKVRTTFSQLPPSASPRQSLDVVIDTCIKPLAKSIPVRSSWFEGFFLIRGATREAITLRPFALPGVTATIYSSIVFLSNQVQPGITASGVNRAEQALLAAPASFVVIAASLMLAGFVGPKLFARFSTTALIAYLTTFIVVALAVTAVNQNIFWDSFDAARFSLAWVSNALTLLVFSTTLSIIGRPGLATPVVLSRTAQRGKLARGQGVLARAAQAITRRQLAQHLHGTIQNRVLALQLSYPGDATGRDSGLEDKVLEIISQSKEDFLNIEEGPLEQRLAGLVHEWASLATVEITTSFETLNPAQERILFTVTQEAVTNSIRHGRAKQLWVTLEQSGPHTFSCEVLDDGTGPLGKRQRRGLGLGLLSMLSDDNWELGFRPEGGARLSATLYC